MPRLEVNDSSVDCLLDMRVDLDHLMVDIGVFAHEHLRVPSHRDEDRIDTGAQGCGEDLTDLQPDEKGEGDNYRCVCSVLVVCGRRENEVEVGEKRAGVRNECSSHGEDRSDKALVH